MKTKRKGQRFPRLTFMTWQAADLQRLTDGVERIMAVSRELQADLGSLGRSLSMLSAHVQGLAVQVDKLATVNQRRAAAAAATKRSRNGQPAAAATPMLAHDGQPIIDVADEGGAA